MKRQAVTGPSTGADRHNRAGLGFLGLLLLAVGGYGLARGWGAFGSRAAHQPLIVESWRRFVDRNEAWFWGVATLAALLVSLLGWRWLRAQVAASAARRVDLTHRGDGGATMVHPAGASQALAAEIERLPGVTAVSARLIGDSDDLEVDLRVTVAETCNVPELRNRIEEEALTRFQRALEFEALDANLEFRVSRA
jgi:hypothetical protein